MSPCRWPGRVLALFALLGAALPSFAASLSFELEGLRSPQLALAGVSLRILGGDRQRAELTIARMKIGAREFGRARIACARFRVTDGLVDCRGGVASAAVLPRPLKIDFQFNTALASGRAELRAEQGGIVYAEWSRGKPLHLRLERVPFAWLAEFLPQMGIWTVAGSISGSVDVWPARVTATLRAEAGGFSNPDGTRAGEQLDLDLKAQAERFNGEWRWRASLAWSGGGIFWSPIYLAAGPSAEATGVWREDGASSLELQIRSDGVETIELSARYAPEAPFHGEVALKGADLAVLGPAFLAPWFAPENPDVWRFAGRFDAVAAFRGGSLLGLDVSLLDVGIAHADGGLSAGPLAGELAWRQGEARAGRIEVGGGRWRKLAFGAFEFPFVVGPTGFTVERVRLPLLDSAVEIRDLEISRAEGGLTGSAGGVVEPLSLKALTEALDLPPMAGVVSASISTIRHRPGELSLDGALVISVFDGFLRATDLHILEPLGRVPRLQADVELRHIDLGLLTQTFEFGRVTGYLDGDVARLQLASWRPIGFEARFRSSPGSYPRRISQRAVQNISALGGGGAAAAIQRSFLGFFESFGYRRMGASCILRNGVCVLAGLEGGDTANGGFTLVEGGGVPALNVIGYNRRVDWNELIARLKAVVESNAAPVVR